MPRDPSPLGDEMANNMPEPKFPQPKPGGESDAPGARDSESTSDMSNRPALPEHPAHTSADIEDEEADPVVDTGPGIADGPKGLKKQRG